MDAGRQSNRVDPDIDFIARVGGPFESSETELTNLPGLGLFKLSRVQGYAKRAKWKLSLDCRTIARDDPLLTTFGAEAGACALEENTPLSCNPRPTCSSVSIAIREFLCRFAATNSPPLEEGRMRGGN